MVKIKITESDKNTNPLINPCKMFDAPHGTIFQQYIDDDPGEDFWISCGLNEKSLINLWFDDEAGCHKLSTDRKRNLREFSKDVKVRRVDGDLKLKLKLEK
jgi:hypothetical protein